MNRKCGRRTNGGLTSQHSLVLRADNVLWDKRQLSIRKLPQDLYSHPWYKAEAANSQSGKCATCRITDLAVCWDGQMQPDRMCGNFQLQNCRVVCEKSHRHLWKHLGSRFQLGLTANIDLAVSPSVLKLPRCCLYQ